METARILYAIKSVVVTVVDKVMNTDTPNKMPMIRPALISGLRWVAANRIVIDRFIAVQIVSPEGSYKRTKVHIPISQKKKKSGGNITRNDRFQTTKQRQIYQ